MVCHRASSERGAALVADACGDGLAGEVHDLAVGPHFVSVSAFDRAGNIGLATIRRFEVR
jgi:hypothetical protein